MSSYPPNAPRSGSTNRGRYAARSAVGQHAAGVSHGGGERVRGGAGVEGGGAFGADPLQDVRLRGGAGFAVRRQSPAEQVGIPEGGEAGSQGRVRLERGDPLDPLRAVVGVERDAPLRQSHRGAADGRPRQHAPLRVGGVQAGDGAGDADGLAAAAGGVRVVGEHAAGRGGGGAFAVVEGVGRARSPASQKTRNPPPPSPQEYGRTTDRLRLVATAASTAFPPARRISAPASAAAGWSAATAAFGRTCRWRAPAAVRPEPRGRTSSRAGKRASRVPVVGGGVRIGSHHPAVRSIRCSVPSLVPADRSLTRNRKRGVGARRRVGW